MTLGTKIIICGVLAIALNLTTAVAGGSNWRWAVFGGASLATVGLVIWMLRILQTTLLRCVGELLRGTQEVAGAAEQVSSASQSLAQGASEQAATLEETSASSQELSSMSQNSANNARSAAEVMRESERLVDSANNTLAEMVTSMTEINNASDKIARIIKVIDEIAFQTNILALNAAVEAARAGEAGKGFAVVADEVRNLAQRSAQAAKDTAGIIEESISKSKEGGKRLDQVKDAISAITESSTKVKALVDEVSVGSQEQAQGFSEITNSIGQMERVTQQAAASAEQSASASAQLSAQAKSMEDAVRFLQSLVHSEDEAPARAKASAPPKQRLSMASAPRRERPVAVPDDLEEAFPMDDDFR